MLLMIKLSVQENLKFIQEDTWFMLWRNLMKVWIITLWKSSEAKRGQKLKRDQDVYKSSEA